MLYNSFEWTGQPTKTISSRSGNGSGVGGVRNSLKASRSYMTALISEFTMLYDEHPNFSANTKDQATGSTYT